MRRGLVLVVSAPSGAGKTTLCHCLLKKDRELYFSVSYTTRPPRPHEKEGEDYFFVSKEVFEEMIKKKAFLEWAQVHGYLYGTAKKQVFTALEKGQDILLEIDVQGAFQVKNILQKDAVLVFILPPSWKELERRLRHRSTEKDSAIKLRLKNAKKELSSADKFDYVVLNKNLEEACKNLVAILKAERQRPFRCQELLKILQK